VSAAPPPADDWRRLSRRMLVIHPVQEAVRAIPALFGLFVAGSQGPYGRYVTLAGLAFAIGLGLSRWWTTSYRVTAAQVEIRRGLLRRRRLAVARDRVRTVDVSAHPWYRALGLARVTVGTGRSDRRDDGLRLDGLAAADAERLHRELLHRPAADGEAATATADGAAVADVELVRLEPRWIAYGPFTLSGVVAVGVVIAYGSHLASEAHVDPARLGPLRATLGALTRQPLPVAVAVATAASLAIVALASTVGYVLAFWGFRLGRHPGGTLHVRRGLVTTRATTIEERRLRGVELSEPLLLRAVGGARCIAIATGLRVGRGAERGGTLLVPPAPAPEVRRVAAAVLGDAVPIDVPLVPHGPAARRRRFARGFGGAALVVLALALLAAAGVVPRAAVLAGLVAFPAAVPLAADRARSLGHAVADGFLVAAAGSLVRRRTMLACDAVIGVNVRASLVQRRAGLATLVATTAAGRQGYRVLDVPEGEALAVATSVVPGLLEPFLT
jgi:putative membrane protein